MQTLAKFLADVLLPTVSVNRCSNEASQAPDLTAEEREESAPEARQIHRTGEAERWDAPGSAELKRRRLAQKGIQTGGLSKLAGDQSGGSTSGQKPGGTPGTQIEFRIKIGIGRS